MSNAWFFEKFELIADLPDAVSRMREIVLELAVQGKLISQESVRPVHELRTLKTLLKNPPTVQKSN